MPYITWTEEFSVKHAEMDKQHQLLFDYVNEYYDALEAGQSNQELVPVFEKIISYTDFHFKDEEKMMQKMQYPDFQKHKLMHETLVKRVLELKDELAQNKAEIAEHIKYFLKNWLTAHIKGIDTQYSEYL